ncbi:hypothetical protein UY3_12116 [Chelonia mydas]|uniref:Uncharacterized protein n=1 Tax=Chelonia mydas TaxID=8469 RepID=M7B0X2_CHEMY|nr:hypothetical protein UY3_12116 [Chelonia mydas]
MKIKELRQTYQKTREANGRSGSEPQTCRFYDELHAILGSAATTTPPLCFDSVQGVGGNTESGLGGEEDDSSQQGSGETGFPNSQDLFVTLTWSQYPPNPPKAGSRTVKAEKGPLRDWKQAPVSEEGTYSSDQLIPELQYNAHVLPR